MDASEEFLLDLLDGSVEYSWTNPWRKEIDSARLKLYSIKGKSESIERFLENPKVELDVRDCKEWLEENSKYQALASLLFSQKRYAEAVDIWKKMEEGVLKDDSFAGLEYLLKKLAL